jgi:hypothetical protein
MRYTITPGKKGTPVHRMACFVGDGGETVEIWPSHNTPGSLLIHRGTRDRNFFPVPDWVINSWHAGEDIRPLLDWLAETYGCEYPFLVELANGPEFV